MLSYMTYHWDNLSDIEMMAITEEIKREKIKGIFSSKEQREQVNALLSRARRDNISNLDIICYLLDCCDELSKLKFTSMLEYQEKIKISRGFVLYGQKGHTLEVIVDIKLRAEVLTVANLIRKACKKAIVPHTAATESQCAQCEYQNFCADRF